MEIIWKCLPFSDLSLEELYGFGRLRQEVFIVEQNCPYLDFDGKDQKAWHVLGLLEGKVLAYARLLPAGTSYPDDASIGRVITGAAVRGTGTGKVLMQQCLVYCKTLFPKTAIRISAQSYLEKFYEGFGFVFAGKRYMEDDIPHTEMLLD